MRTTNKIYKELDENTRNRIKRRYWKGMELFMISVEMGISYGLVKEYIKIFTSSEIIDGQRVCNQCNQPKTLDKYWGGKGAKCSQCCNDNRNNKRNTDGPDREKRLIKKRISEKKRYEKNYIKVKDRTIEEQQKIKEGYKRRRKKEGPGIRKKKLDEKILQAKKRLGEI